MKRFIVLIGKLWLRIAAVQNTSSFEFSVLPKAILTCDQEKLAKLHAILLTYRLQQTYHKTSGHVLESVQIL